MKLLLFGGTFDPPHKGHMSILKNAIAAVQPDAVWVVPADTPPHKQASATPAALRLAMCACFKPLFPGLVVSDIEIGRGGKSYTVDTVAALQQQYPGVRVYLCIGSDMLLTFTEWRSYRTLLHKVVLVAQCRESEDRQAAVAAALALAREGGRILFASGQIEEISSTQLRAAIAAGKQVGDSIPPPAAALVARCGLYHGTPQPTPQGEST